MKTPFWVEVFAIVGAVAITTTAMVLLTDAAISTILIASCSGALARCFWFSD